MLKIVFLCVLMSVYQFTSYVVTVVCQLLINGYVMLCYVFLSIIRLIHRCKNVLRFKIC